MDWLMQAVCQVFVRDWLTQAGRTVTFNICLCGDSGDCPLALLARSLSCAFIMNVKGYFLAHCLVLCSLFCRVESTSQGCPCSPCSLFLD